ncbi:hypothetical protein, partial [Paenibacillus silagei]|uniref:hypothetical protein n=1 Tax=Paenibacillus silagei TaxID=1670801 RepID=UPI001AE3BCFA
MKILLKIQHYPAHPGYISKLLHKKQDFSSSKRLAGAILAFYISVLISQKKGQKRPPFRVMVSTTKPNRNEATS